MTPPKDPNNARYKSTNSSRPAMDAADALLKSELVDNEDGRWRYKDYLGERQTDGTIAQRSGCNESFVARQRRKNYGPLVPQQSEDARAAKRGKKFGRPFEKKPAPPEPEVTEQLDRIEAQQRDTMALLKALHEMWAPAGATEGLRQ